MYIEYPEQLTKDSFSDTELYHELMSIEDELDRQSEAQKLRMRAKELGVTNVFEAMFTSAIKSYNKHLKVQKTEQDNLMGLYETDFSILNDEISDRFLWLRFYSQTPFEECLHLSL